MYAIINLDSYLNPNSTSKSSFFSSFAAGGAAAVFSAMCPYRIVTSSVRFSAGSPDGRAVLRRPAWENPGPQATRSSWARRQTGPAGSSTGAPTRPVPAPSASRLPLRLLFAVRSNWENTGGGESAAQERRVVFITTRPSIIGIFQFGFTRSSRTYSLLCLYLKRK